MTGCTLQIVMLCTQKQLLVIFVPAVYPPSVATRLRFQFRRANCTNLSLTSAYKWARAHAPLPNERRGNSQPNAHTHTYVPEFAWHMRCHRQFFWQLHAYIHRYAHLSRLACVWVSECVCVQNKQPFPLFFACKHAKSHLHSLHPMPV